MSKVFLAAMGAANRAFDLQAHVGGLRSVRDYLC